VKCILWLALAVFVSVAAAGERSSKPALTIAEIVAKNVEARGGLEAWRKIDTMIWVGRIDSERASPEGLPFLLQMKRPRKTRFEIKSPTEQAVRAFDGNVGWKAHPGHNGQQNVNAFTPDELTFAKDGEGLDGLLIDCEVKGIKVTLDGKEPVEGAEAYRLRVVMPSGAVRHVWVDAHSFLEVRQDREARNAAGVGGVIQVRYRNYQTVGDVKIPMTIETGSASAKGVDKMLIERVAINPPIEDRIFTRPHVPRSNAVTVAPERVQPPLSQAPARPASAQPPLGSGSPAPSPEATEPR
jgi:hypothetical protein